MMTGDKAALYDRKATSGIAVADAATKAWSAAKDIAGAKLPWVLVGYDPAVKDSIILKAEGSAGYEEMQAAFKPDEVLYGACAFHVGAATRFFFVTFVGSEVAGMKKARVGVHKSGIYKAFEGVIADVTINDAEEADIAVVEAKLRKDTSATDIRLK